MKKIEHIAEDMELSPDQIKRIGRYCEAHGHRLLDRMQKAFVDAGAAKELARKMGAGGAYGTDGANGLTELIGPMARAGVINGSGGRI